MTTTPVPRLERDFTTGSPARLHAEIGRGRVLVTATATDRTTVTITGKAAEDYTVTADDDLVSIIAPRQRSGFFGSSVGEAEVEVVVPTGSHLDVRAGSAPVTAEGRYGACRVRSGSGTVRLGESTGPTRVQTGSGSIRVARAEGDLRAQAGSGDVVVGEAGASVGISTGSGTVHLGRIGSAAAVKTGSGEVEVDRTEEELSVRTGSGSVAVGQLAAGTFTARTGSGSVTVGVPGDIPVWTDIGSASGRISSDLTGAGAPREGQDHLEIRATTASGDVTLHQLRADDHA